MRKARTKAVAVVLQNTWGAKNNIAFIVVVMFGSLLSSSTNHLRCLSQQILATRKRLERMPPICMNWEKIEFDDSPVTKVTYVTAKTMFNQMKLNKISKREIKSQNLLK